MRRSAPAVPVCVIINSSAGSVVQAGAALSPAAVERTFQEAGLHPEIHYVPGPEVGETVRAAVARRPEAIVVGGGDGTLSTAAGFLVDTGIPFGILPLGTLNHFSKDLQIPSDLSQAVAIIAAKHLRPIDVGEVNGRIFLNNCSVGAYPEAVRRRDALQKQRGHGKWRAMSLAWLQVLQNLRRLRVQLTLDQRTLQRRTPVVLISNNRYAGHLFTSNLRERLDAGELWVYTTRCHRFFPLLRLAALAALGRLDEAEDFESWPVRELRIELASSSLNIGTDGEVTEFQLPLQFRIRPRALLVLAPTPVP